MGYCDITLKYTTEVREHDANFDTRKYKYSWGEGKKLK